jgi:hypothetical protein
MTKKFEFHNLKQLQALIRSEAEKIVQDIIEKKYPNLEALMEANEYFDPRSDNIDIARLSAKKLIFGLSQDATLEDVKYHEKYYELCDKLKVPFDKSYSDEMLEALSSIIKNKEKETNNTWEYAELEAEKVLEFQQKFEQAWVESSKISTEHKQLIRAFTAAEIKMPKDSYSKKIVLK